MEELWAEYFGACLVQKHIQTLAKTALLIPVSSVAAECRLVFKSIAQPNSKIQISLAC